jgi:hypothetical protein
MAVDASTRRSARRCIPCAELARVIPSGAAAAGTSWKEVGP